MDPLKIRLSAHEVMAITMIMEKAACAELRPDMKNETIILAENWRTWLKRFAAANSNKPKLYLMPVSVARTLHYRLQMIPLTQANQTILTKLDQELTNINMKPFPTRLL
jgi:hypothetical protein